MKVWERILSDNFIVKSDQQSSTIKNEGDNNVVVSSYSTVTLFARLRG